MNSNEIKCDAPDCCENATTLAWLNKVPREVRLCSRHFTRFALRGLLRLDGSWCKEILSVDISDWTLLRLEDYLSVSENC